MSSNSASLESRFWAKVDKRGPDDCWLWIARCNAQGYGKFSLPVQRKTGAHRFSWELAHGRPVPAGLFVCHSCDNPPCVNPAHLWIGTHTDNMRDMVEKGRLHGGRGVRGNRNPRARLTSGDVEIIREMKGALSPHDIAARFGVGRSHVLKIQNGSRW